MPTSIARILRYPVKGLDAEPLEAVDIPPGSSLPHDRRFAIAGTAALPASIAGIGPASGFLTPARCEKLSALSIAFDTGTDMLVIRRNGRQVARGCIALPTGRLLVEQFLAAYLQGDVPGVPRIVEAPAGISFTDAPEPSVSLLNLASLADLERRIVQMPIDPVRLRANLLVTGGQPWEEWGWIGRRLCVGDTVLEVIGTMEAPESADLAPGTGQRDMNLTLALMRATGRKACGVRARVASGGRIAVGNRIEILD